MFNVFERDSVLKQFKDDAIEKVENACADVDIVTFMKDANVDCIKSCVGKIESCIIAVIPQGIAVPKVTIHTTATGEDEVTLITISASNKISTRDKRKFKESVKVTKNNTIEEIRDFFIGLYADLIVDEMIEENLEPVNKVLQEVVNRSGLSYEISVVSPFARDGKLLYSILDDEVVFVADVDRAFELSDILVVQEPSEDITEEMINAAIDAEVEIISSCQTTEQLVAKHGGMLVEYVCNINKQIRPMTLIKKVCNKDVTKVKGANDTFAYFNNGEVFSILYRRDGEFEIALSPFDIKTFRKADFDVLGAIKG